MSKIDQNQFCYLSNSDLFLRWLYSTDIKLYTELIEHLRRGLGCGANREKMIDIYASLTKAGHDKNLEQFLKKNYPNMIVGDQVNDKPIVVGNTNNFAALNKHKVFSHYDPTLATYPRRLIITQLDAGQMSLGRIVLSFCSQQDYCEHVVVDDRAYIEYLPHGYGNLKNKIPDKNWQVRAYKRSR